MSDGKGILIRTAEQTDMESVIELLQSLSEFKPSKSDFSNIWRCISEQCNVYSLVAIIDKQVVGYGSIVIEVKIRGGKMVHVEDIVSDPLFRKKGIGKAILDALFAVAKENGCYKVALNCKEHNIKFYEKCDFSKSGVAMQRFVKQSEC